MTGKWLLIGREIFYYSIIDRLGEGSMSVLYLPQAFAADPAASEQFSIEARQASSESSQYYTDMPS